MSDDYIDPFDRYYFELVTKAAARALRDGANPQNFYDIDPVGSAVVKARTAMREARRLGFYPSTADLEQEHQQAHQTGRAA